MQIIKISPNSFKKAYNISCQFLYDLNVDTPFGMTWCEIPINGSTEKGDHAEFERFLILSGQGVMHINTEQENVSAYDLVHIPPFAQHQLINTGKTPLVFLSIYADGLGVNQPINAAAIFSSPPTPNGELHLGHFSGPYLAADVIKRYYKLRGKTITHITGTDDFQSYVSFQSIKEEKTAPQTALNYRKKIQETFDQISIEYDQYYHPQNDKSYQAFVQSFFQKLIDNGKIYQKVMETPYCKTCEIFVLEGTLIGTCVACKSEVTGPACEYCGFLGDLSGNVNNPCCRICHKECTQKDLLRYVFPIESYKSKLKKYIDTVNMSPKSMAYIYKMLAQPWEDIPVTMPTTWGIVTPNSSSDVQETIHPWFEMAAAYAYYHNKNENIQCFGIDNRFYYMLYNPALLMAYDQNILLPSTFIENSFYQINQQKFSKSHIASLKYNQFIKKITPDVLRWYLAHTRPERSENNFSVNKFHAFTEKYIINKLNAIITHTNQLKSQCRPLTTFEKEFIIQLRSFKRQAMTYYNPKNFSLRNISRLLTQLLIETYDWLSPFSNSTLLVCSLKIFVMIASPIMPTYTEALRKALKMTPWEDDFVIPENTMIHNLPLLLIEKNTTMETTCVQPA